jgi:long-chain acyl-CoA synthetase
MIPGLVDRLDEVLEIGLRLTPDKDAIVQRGKRITYEELDARVNRVANALGVLGVGRGDRVLIALPNDSVFVEVFLGTIRAGAVAVPANPRQVYSYLRYVAEDSAAVVAVVPTGRRAELNRARVELPALAHLVLIDLEGVPAADSCLDDEISYEDWLRSAPSTRREPSVAPTEVCMQPYTSGTTGRPKGVLLDHRGQLANAEAVRAARMLRSSERAVVAVPIFHANALSGTVLPILLATGTLVIVPAFDPTDVLAAIANERCTSMGGVPAMFRMLLDALPTAPAFDLTSVRHLTCGSAPVPPQLLAELEVAFPRAAVSESYGLTEGGPVVLGAPRMGLVKHGSTGVPLPGIEVRLGQHGDVPIGDVGELWVRNDGVTLGFHNLPEMTADRIDGDGWLRTGDLLRCDADGYYFFVGRVDDMINTGGENVYPSEVECVLLEHPGIVEACVVGLPHAIKGEVPVAFIVVELHAELNEEGVRAFALERGPAHSHPRRVEIVDAMPLTAAGKLDRSTLVARAREVFGAAS